MALYKVQATITRTFMVETEVDALSDTEAGEKVEDMLKTGEFDHELTLEETETDTIDSWRVAPAWRQVQHERDRREHGYG